MARNTPTKVSHRALLVLALVALGGYAFDQISKALVVSSMTEGETARVLGDVLQLHFIRNPGAAFSFATGLTWVFSLIAAGVVVFIVWFARRIRSLRWATVFGLLLGGVLGNLTDRLFREPSFGLGHVVDFISTPWMMPAIYNIADSCIVVSMVIFMLLTIRGIGLDGRRTTSADAAASAADESPATPAPLVTPN
ncbi:signal peptidase II [Cryobacterium sp. PAMC25264]|uniref:signal peptidase II n=1 Tax=Cryobacterium sp. PAMC25264 TaxID=2861288 RepID=UPI001C6352EF|nr:signal peptidase II [Cryobacterium sp. PAMC25264]QYF74729.1 signal peptidase II [Cryobacterium sp. PAMC25264]